MDEHLQEDQLGHDVAGLDEAVQVDDVDADIADDEDFMDLVDPMIDKASRDGDDSVLDEAEAELGSEVDVVPEVDAEDEIDAELDDSEFDENMEFDELDAFMDDDADGADELAELDIEGLVDGEDLEEELKVPLTASQQALAARRAIEERAEARRIERDLNYLDFELDD